MNKWAVSHFQREEGSVLLKARSEKPTPTGSYHVAPFLFLFFSFGVMEYLLFGQYGLVLFGFLLFFYFSYHLHPLYTQLLSH